MSYEGAITLIRDTHLETAATSVTPRMLTRRGDFATAPASKYLAVWYEGDQQSSLIPPTLGDVSIGERVTVSGVWPVGNFSDENAALVDKEIRAIVRSVTNALRGDSQLGGNCADLTIGSAEVGWREWTGQVARAFEISLEIHLAGEEAIAA